jgi:hypothetical protein
MKITGTAVTANIVAGAAFLASAQHIYKVAHEAGNPESIAAVHAVGIDGLILIGINALKVSRVAGIVAILYGAGVSLVFNAASYGAFEMHPLALAVTMPVALVLAYVTVQASARTGQDAGTQDGGTGQEKATSTEVDIRVSRQSVPRPAARSVPSTVSHPIVSQPVQRSATVVPSVQDIERPAIGSVPRPAPRGWDPTLLITAREKIEAGGKSDREVAREVFGPDATDSDRKKIERLRRGMNGTA